MGHPFGIRGVCGDHDAWATGQLIGACEGLSPEQLHRAFEMGMGSMYLNVQHIIGAMRGWADVLVGREARVRLEAEGKVRSVGELRALHAETAAEFAEEARRVPLDSMVTRERGGKVYSFNRGIIVTHVTTHGMHHRAQCLNMFRQMGVALPKSSVLEWMLVTGLFPENS